MTQLKYFRKALLLFALWSYPVLATTIFHKIDVKLSPDESLLSVLDVLTFPDQLCEQPFVEFKLHAGLEPVVLTPGVHLSLQETVPSRVPLEVYKLKLPSGVCSVEISYGGEIEYAPVGESSPGTIESRGVFLGGSTWWYPEVEGRLLAFNMTATVPKDWSVVSQGELASQSKGEEESEFVWQELLPQDDIYLIAAEFFYYSLQQDGLLAEAWLRTPDEQLAEKYLKVTHSYIKMYSESIGPYPYKKFALVENFWPTGFGMPSFTLLGSSIIRLPFILYTSYPHEVLHNWWGNGVYVDYGQGNWSEGLTSYQADHDFKAMRGQGHEYRRDALNNFSAYVNKDNDFPLAEFVGRFDRASSAIGYGKAMMLFHMLKVRLSESVFSDGIRDFYAHNLFQKSGYSELRDSFEKVSSEELSRFFQQWVHRIGAPELRLLKAERSQVDVGWRVDIEVQQAQADSVYELHVPVKVDYEDGTSQVEVLKMSRKTQNWSLEKTKAPKAVSVDADFDVFRTLFDEEVPASLAKVFGSEEPLTVVLPSGDSRYSSYQQFASVLEARLSRAVTVIDDVDLNELPLGAVWVLGWGSKFSDDLSCLFENQNASLSEDHVLIGGERFERVSSPLVVAFKSSSVCRRGSGQVVWTGLSEEPLPEELAIKMFRYGGYSYIGFNESLQNKLKGTWATKTSPLKKTF